VLTPVRSGHFKRDLRRAEKRGKDMDKLKAVLLLLIERKGLPAKFNDHPLKGNDILDALAAAYKQVGSLLPNSSHIRWEGNLNRLIFHGASVENYNLDRLPDRALHLSKSGTKDETLMVFRV